ncbi:MAG TPA: T9SS type A sorting domain-containing protein, partial [Candidatus Kapabacteria bacterium]|nr:T9SS type A sorting domain-containing protein [Candidatus Kapabacteria bacterium]
EYFIGFVLPSFNRQVVSEPQLQQHFRVSLLIAALFKATVTISYYDDRGAEIFDHTVTIQGHQSATVPLDLTKLLGDTTGDVATYHTCHVVSNGAISVQCYSTGVCSGGSYLALPPQCWGKEYVVMSYHDNPDGIGGLVSNERSRGFFEIVASENATQIEITPSSRTAGGHEGIYYGEGATGIPKPYSITLNRGQSYTVFSEGSSSESDISGSRITASKPIGVIAGHENAYSDDSYVEPFVVDERNFMIQQLIPVECWDTSYSSAPLFEKSVDPGNQYRLLFGEGYKTKKVNGNVTVQSIKQNIPIGKNQFPQASKSLAVGSTWFSTDSKFALMQYGHRRQNPAGISPTPTTMNVIPDQCWKQYFAFTVPEVSPIEQSSNYITIITDLRELEFIMVSFNGRDPVPIKAAASLQKTDELVNSYHGTRGYVFHLQPGSYVVTSWSPLALYNYGFQSVTISNTQHSFSYGSPAGMGFKQRGLPASSMISSVQSECGAFHICVKSNSILNGIKYVSIDSGKAAFDLVLDPLGKGEIVLSGNDTSFCFTVNRTDLSDRNTIGLSVYDRSGAVLSIPIRLVVDACSITEMGKTEAGDLVDDTLRFAGTNPGVPLVKTLKVHFFPDHNFGTHFVGEINSSDGAVFQIIKTEPALPKQDFSDSLIIHLQFRPSHLGRHIGTIYLGQICQQSVHFSVTGDGVTGSFIATDIEFGEHDIGSSDCKVITLANGTYDSVIVFRAQASRDTSNFNLDNDYFLKLLPVELLPGASIEMFAWFHPKKAKALSKNITWMTDLSPELKVRSKTISTLTGRGSGFEPDLGVEDKTAALAPHSILGLDGIKEYSIYDLLGRSIFHSTDVGNMTLPKLPQGIYIVHISFENGDILNKTIRMP